MRAHSHYTDAHVLSMHAHTHMRTHICAHTHTHMHKHTHYTLTHTTLHTHTYTHYATYSHHTHTNTHYTAYTHAHYTYTHTCMHYTTHAHILHLYTHSCAHYTDTHTHTHVRTTLHMLYTVSIILIQFSWFVDLDNSINALQIVNTTIAKLLNLTKALQTELDDLAKNIQTLKGNCHEAGLGSRCDRIPDEQYTVNVDYTVVSNVVW